MQIEQKFYLTKKEGNKMWNYITDPVNPTGVQQMGLVVVEDPGEIKVDGFGAYVVRISVFQ